MNRVKYFLNQTCLKSMYYSFIHSYISYGNIVWGNSCKSRYSKLLLKQKFASRVILNKNRFTPSKPLMQSLGILDIHQVNIFQTLLFMFKYQNKLTPNVFLGYFSKFHSRFTTRSENLNYTIVNRRRWLGNCGKIKGLSIL